MGIWRSGSLREEEAWRKGELAVKVCARAKRLAPSATGAAGEFAVCSPAAHTERRITCAWRAREGSATCVAGARGRRGSSTCTLGLELDPAPRLKGATGAALLGSGEGTSDFAAPSVAFPLELLCPCESSAANFLVPARPSATAGGWEYVLQRSEFL